MMKKTITLLFLLGINQFQLMAQYDIWVQLDNVNGAPKSACVGFALNGEGYIGLGLDEMFERKQLYSYDVVQDDWDNEQALGNAPGNGLQRCAAVSFAIGNVAYVGLGSSTGNAYFMDLWEYNPTTNTWSQMANFEGTARRHAVGFSINNLGYVGTGVDIDNVYRKDFWEFDPLMNDWTQLNDFGGTARQSAVGFSMGNFGFVGTGDDGVPRNDFWQYDPALDQWTQKPDFGGSARAGAVGFGIYPQAVIATGYDIDLNYTNDVWEFNLDSNYWVQRNDFPGVARTTSVAFVIDDMAYMGTGYNDDYLDDFWGYTPAHICVTDTSTIVSEACSSAGYSWINGNTYMPIDGTGPFYHTLPAQSFVGCDSVVTLFINWIETDTSVTVSNACTSGYQWINGTTYIPSDGTGPWYYTLSGQSFQGCDSVATLYLNWIEPDTSVTYASGCVNSGYQWIDGNTYTSMDGTGPWYYTLSGASIDGCDSVATLYIDWGEIDNMTVNNDGTTLTSNAGPGNTFQWVDCDNGYAPISGETGQDFTPSLTGNYAVIVDNSMCSDTSACETIISYAGLEEYTLFDGVNIYPNPTVTDVYITLGDLKDVSLKVYEISGKLVYAADDIATSTYHLMLDNAAGVYYLELENGGLKKRFKLIKK